MGETLSYPPTNPKLGPAQESSIDMSNQSTVELLYTLVVVSVYNSCMLTIYTHDMVHLYYTSTTVCGPLVDGTVTLGPWISIEKCRACVHVSHKKFTSAWCTILLFSLTTDLQITVQRLPELLQHGSQAAHQS